MSTNVHEITRARAVIIESLEMKSVCSTMVLALGLSGLMALTGCDDVHNSDEAVAAAERACTDVIYHGPFALKPDEKLGWLAYPQTSETGQGDGWLVASSYDASRPGKGLEPPSMAYIRIELFVPRKGKPARCVGMVD